MSALNHFLFDDCAVLLTDGVTNIDGVVDWIGSKARRFPHLNAAAGCTGAPIGSWIADTHVGRTARTFDDLVADLAGDVAAGIEDYRPEVRYRNGEGLNDILVVGYSTGAGGWQAWRVTFGLKKAPVVKRQSRASLQPWTAEMSAELKTTDVTIDGILADPTTAVARASRIMEIQRRQGEPHNCAIGGFQEATFVQAGMILSTVVNFWPDDRIGARVSLS